MANGRVNTVLPMITERCVLSRPSVRMKRINGTSTAIDGTSGSRKMTTVNRLPGNRNRARAYAADTASGMTSAVDEQATMIEFFTLRMNPLRSKRKSKFSSVNSVGQKPSKRAGETAVRMLQYSGKRTKMVTKT